MKNYFEWLLSETRTTWWHDSADPAELALALGRGASGVTTNPFLSAQTLRQRPEYWREHLRALPADLRGDALVEARMGAVLRDTAAKLDGVFAATRGAQGYVCAQVNPSKAADREAMLAQAHRHHALARNIAVKLPVTAAGLDVLEACAAEGITTTMTVSFTLPQVLAIAEAFRRGRARAQQANKPDGRCFAVVMIGRLDDYLRDVALDRQAAVNEADIRQAGLAVVKRAVQIFRERRYEATLLIAALRGTWHMTELAGAELVMSISPDNQTKLLAPDVVREQRIDVPIAADVIERLQRIPEFVKAYEPDGMSPHDFIMYGATQRTLMQFIEAGWKLMEA